MKRVAVPSPATLALALCGVMLVGGFVLKAQCLGDWSDLLQMRRLCYNDIQPLYGIRGIAEDRFPYVGGRLVDGELIGVAIEYPVLTGLFMWAAGLLVSTVDQYLIVSAILLAPFALVTTSLLTRLSGIRALMWAGAPALVLYAFHNWDLLVVATVVAGFFDWHRERHLRAALWFGVGGALKVYPLLFIPVLALERWLARDRTGALRTAGAGLGIWGAINVPFALADAEGWWTTYQFHRQRGPNYDSIWSLGGFGDLRIPYMGPAQLNRVTAVLTGLFIVTAVGVGLWRWRRSGTFPSLAVCAAVLASFLLWNKVHSPQYTLWILPFFVLLPIGWGWWAAYSLVDLAVYVGVFRFFYDACSFDPRCSPPPETTWAQRLLELGVFGRAGLLLVLFAVFLLSKTAVVSHPTHMVSAQGDRQPA